MKLALIAAFGTNGAIGYKGQMPWKCATDMKHFRKVTMGNDYACVMGRRTWDSLPDKKLPGRICIVLTSQPITGRCLVASSYEQAVEMAKYLNVKKLFIIGGSRLFNEHYDSVDELFLTHIHEEVTEADTFIKFDIKPHRWRLIESQVHGDCTINRWVRR